MEIKNSLEDFVTVCDEMINGKFIMADSKISKILESIANNKALYNVVNECLIGYNFQEEYEKALIKIEHEIYDIFEDENKIIAFVMYLFIEVDNNRVKFYDFINKFFTYAGAGNEYQEFVKTMLKPFKEMIVARYISYLNSENIITTNKEENFDVYDKLKEQLLLLKNEIQFSNKFSSKKKEELNMYLSGCVEAVKLKNKKIISALATAIDKELHREKSVKETYIKVTSLLLQIYE